MKSHFLYTKQQRNGILLLLSLIVTMQLVYHLVDFKKDNIYSLDKESMAFQAQIDSLKQIASEKSKPRIFPFNPNFITDYKGYQLGMSIQEIDRLHEFREKGKFVNSASEFQLITKVSDSLLDRISKYFKFPSWTQKNKSKRKVKKFSFNDELEKDETLISTTDINLATLTDFLAVKDVDEFLSERIIKYRTKLQGFVFADQIFEVWGLEKEVGQKILEKFSIQSIPKIQKVNVNTATFKEVLSIPYIDYELCKKIFDYRDEVAELQDISEIKNIEDFPLDKYNRIVVYLFAE